MVIASGGSRLSTVHSPRTTLSSLLDLMMKASTLPWNSGRVRSSRTLAVLHATTAGNCPMYMPSTSVLQRRDIQCSALCGNWKFSSSSCRQPPHIGHRIGPEHYGFMIIQFCNIQETRSSPPITCNQSALNGNRKLCNRSRSLYSLAWSSDYSVPEHYSFIIIKICIICRMYPQFAASRHQVQRLEWELKVIHRNYK